MKDNIAIVSAYTKAFSEQADISRELTEKFCANTGCEYFAEEIPPGFHPMFFKFQLVKKHLNDHAIVVWKDLDCCICDFEFKLREALETWSTPATKLWIAQDWNGLCCCFWAVRNCDWAHEYVSGMATWGIELRYLVDGNLERLLRCGNQTDQFVVKAFHAFNMMHRWRFSLLPYSVVTERASRPWPKPFAWHLGPTPLELMKGLRDAVREGTEDKFLQDYEPMYHGIRFDP